MVRARMARVQAILEDGDQTQIGEKGINLSGGQKQRIAMARAVYANRELYLFDDPLSAVDAHVGKHIFDQVMGPTGMLRNKTRVFVTHAIQFLPGTDQVICLERSSSTGLGLGKAAKAVGRIEACGSYDELIAAGGKFAAFIAAYAKKAEKEAEEAQADEPLVGVLPKSPIAKAFSRGGGGGTDGGGGGGGEQVAGVGFGNQGGSSTAAQKLRAAEVRPGSSLNHEEAGTSSEKTALLGGGKKSAPKGIISKERREEGAVMQKIYAKYFRALGGKLVAIVIAMYCIAYAAQMGTNKWLAIWSEDYDTVVNNVTATVTADGAVSTPVSRFDGSCYSHTYTDAILADPGSTPLAPSFACSAVHQSTAAAAAAAAAASSSSSSSDPEVFEALFRNGTAGNGSRPRRQSSMSKAKTGMYLGVYAALGGGYSLGTLISAVALALAGVHASENLHKGMLAKILRAPMVFFETTPTGRIVSRFSQDVNMIDEGIPRTIQSLISCMMQVLTTLIAIGMTTPYFLLASVLLGAVYYSVQRYYIPTSRQLQRIESTTRSPIYSHFGETINGVTSIRAYNMVSVFKLENENKIDYNLQARPLSSSPTPLPLRLPIYADVALLRLLVFAACWG
jgi:ABC-type multidrug transport system fused ATPase/permease subunit